MTIIVGEVGINHSGNLKTAIKLIDMAADCGAHVAKFQKRTPELCVPGFEWNKPKETPWGTTEKYIDYKRALEFSYEQYKVIYNHCVSRGIQFAASVWDIPSLEFITRFDVPFVKLPSALITNRELVQATIDTGVPVVMSTGMSTAEEIDACVKMFPDDYDLTILHCHSSYPTPESEVNLKAIKTLRDCYGRKTGYSSHDSTPHIPIASVLRYDADFVEVHICLNRADPGSDMAASFERKGLELIVREINRVKVIDGDGHIKLWNTELKARGHLRG